MAIEIVSFPINSMVIFHSYVNVYQRVTAVQPQRKQLTPIILETVPSFTDPYENKSGPLWFRAQRGSKVQGLGQHTELYHATGLIVIWMGFHGNHIMWVKQCHLHHPPVITIRRWEKLTIPSHGGFMTLFYPPLITLTLG